LLNILPDAIVVMVIAQIIEVTMVKPVIFELNRFAVVSKSVAAWAFAICALLSAERTPAPQHFFDQAAFCSMQKRSCAMQNSSSQQSQNHRNANFTPHPNPLPALSLCFYW
jgi:hypothetical protein